MNIIYYILLLLIIFMFLFLFEKINKYCPRKIKIYMSICLSMYLIRYFVLVLLCVISNGAYVHLLKNFIYLNYLAVPLIIIGLSYVFLRWDKLNFNVNYFILSASIFIYFIIMTWTKAKIVLDIDYGYLIKINSDKPLLLMILFILGILLLLCLFFGDKPNSNKRGMIYLILGIIVSITELIAYVGGLIKFPYPIMGDLLFLIIINLAINTFKKRIN